MFKRLLNGIRPRPRWTDADEYQRARWAYEGQGVASTKAAWVLGGCLVAVTVYAGIVTRDRDELATLHRRETLVVETNRTTGDIVSVSKTTGTLVLDETKRRQFARYWLGLWRTVPTDPVAFGRNYRLAQVYMATPVLSRVEGHLTAHPVKDFIKQGHARMVDAVTVTPTGIDGVRYRLDWVERVYRGSQLVSTTEQTADIDLRQHTPRDDEEAEFNMFGLVVEGFYWTPPPGMA